MKTIKNRFRIIMLLTLLSFTFTSCDNNEDEVLVIVISEEQAAEIVASSLAYNTYGMASNVHYVSNEIANELSCNEQDFNNGTIHYTSPFGYVTSTYQFDETYGKDCEVEETVNYSILAYQDIDAVYFTSQQDVDACFSVTGLEDTSINELYSGSYEREGDWYSKVYHDSLDVLYAMSFTNLNVDKDTYYITSGTSTFNLNANYSESSNDNSFSGSVTFLNQDEAQIDFNNGNSYLLNLETGEITLM